MRSLEAFMLRISKSLRAKGIRCTDSTSMSASSWEVHASVSLPLARLIVPVICGGLVHSEVCQANLETAIDMGKAITALMWDPRGFVEALEQVPSKKSSAFRSLLTGIAQTPVEGTFEDKFDDNLTQLIAMCEKPSQQRASSDLLDYGGGIRLQWASTEPHPTAMQVPWEYLPLSIAMGVLQTVAFGALETARIAQQCLGSSVRTPPTVSQALQTQLQRQLWKDGSMASAMQVLPVLFSRTSLGFPLRRLVPRITSESDYMAYVFGQVFASSMVFVVALIFSQPLINCRIQMAASPTAYGGMRHCLGDEWDRKWLGVYRGFGVGWVLEAIRSLVSLLLYDTFLAYRTRGFKLNKDAEGAEATLEKLLGGWRDYAWAALQSVLVCLAVHPFETVRQQLIFRRDLPQEVRWANPFTGGDGLRLGQHMVEEQGFGALWHGLPLSLVVALMFTLTTKSLQPIIGRFAGTMTNALALGVTYAFLLPAIFFF